MNRWYVVNTHPQKEAQAREHLRRQGFEVYLPVWRKRRSHARRVEWIAAPLFPRYLFVGFNPDVARWRAIHSTIGVAHLVSNGGLPLPVPDGIVEAIRAREGANGLVAIKPNFRAGQSLLVTDGPFHDQIGVFAALDDAERVTVLLNLLGREIAVKVSAASVRAA